MNALKYLISATFSVLIIIILLISSVEIAAFNNIDYYMKEYEKYNVYENVDADRDKLRQETIILLEYMKSNDKEDIDKFENSTFYHKDDILHMKDVRKLTRGTITIRRIAYALAFGMLLLLIKMKTKVRTVFYSFMSVLGVSVAAVGTLVYIGLNNFKKAFYIFHELFFNNDLWLLDPKVSPLINMLPSGFFVDTFFRICIVFIIMIIISAAVIFLVMKKTDNR